LPRGMTTQSAPLLLTADFLGHRCHTPPPPPLCVCARGGGIDLGKIPCPLELVGVGRRGLWRADIEVPELVVWCADPNSAGFANVGP